MQAKSMNTATQPTTADTSLLCVHIPGTCSFSSITGSQAELQTQIHIQANQLNYIIYTYIYELNFTTESIFNLQFLMAFCSFEDQKCFRINKKNMF